MQTTVKTICDFMEAWAPKDLAYPWDKVGLHTGHPAQPVSGVLVCLTVTPEALRMARKVGATLIIAHHPLIWDPLATLRTDDPHVKLCVDLAKADMACFVAHTNLDIARGGVNDTLAERLALMEWAPLFPADHVQSMKLITFVPADHVDALRNALAAAGAGIIGNYTHCSFQAEGTGAFLPNPSTTPFSGTKGVLSHEPELRFEMLFNSGIRKQVVKALYDAHPYEEPAFDLVPLANRVSNAGLGAVGALEKPMRLAAFAAFVRETLGLSYVQLYGEAHRSIRRVAVLGGSGGKLIQDLPDNVDVFVTGDICYHEAHTAKLMEVACIDAGHAGTELPVLDTIAKGLKTAFKRLPVRIFREQPPGAVYC